jgi:hypothetical protein
VVRSGIPGEEVPSLAIMAYCLNIQRLPLNEEGEPTPIPLEDWKSALSSTEGARLCVQKALTITNPKTGEVIKIPHREGDAEVYFPDDRTWRAVFGWFRGSASFRASVALERLPNPVWSVAANLASHLGAVIRSDDGEIYDLQSGKVTDV